MTSNENEIPHLGKYVILSIIGILLLMAFFSTFYTISAGYRGVLLTFGKANQVPITEGLHFKLPFVQQIIKMEIKTQKYEADLTAASNDLQDINTKIAINYHLEDTSVSDIYTKIGIGYGERVIYPAEQEINKEITSKYTAQELITKRQEVRDAMTSKLRDKLQPRGIIIEDVNIINFKFSDSFSQAIEAKVTAEQSALAAKNKLEQVKYEAEQKIASATAEAEALRLQKMQVTPELIQLRQIEVQKSMIDKWSGNLPIVMGGNANIMDISSILGTKQ